MQWCVEGSSVLENKMCRRSLLLSSIIARTGRERLHSYVGATPLHARNSSSYTFTWFIYIQHKTSTCIREYPLCVSCADCERTTGVLMCNVTEMIFACPGRANERSGVGTFYPPQRHHRAKRQVLSLHTHICFKRRFGLKNTMVKKNVGGYCMSIFHPSLDRHRHSNEFYSDTGHLQKLLRVIVYNFILYKYSVPY